MIFKYKQKNAWGYIDNVSQIGHEKISQLETIRLYMDELTSGRKEDLVEEYVEGRPIEHKTYLSNIIFNEATRNIDIKGNVHYENLLNENNIPLKYDEVDPQTSIIVLYLEGCKEYDTTVLVTNQECYLMNNEGKTIERLV